MSKSDASNFSVLELRALWAINREPKHAYALLKGLNQNRERKLTNGTLYPVLKKLAGFGLIKAEKKRGKREKKTLRATTKGKKALAREAEEFCATYNEIFRSTVCPKCGGKIGAGKKKGALK